MANDLLEIRSRKLKFALCSVELRKHSTCAVRLFNNSIHYVAFKVKTTSPNKYCVRPNPGVVKPKSVFDFTVTMLAHRVVPLDLKCKDKFLIQSTVVPVGTTEENITPSTFSKDGGTYIEETKMKVVLLGPIKSSEIDETLKRDAYSTFETKSKLLNKFEASTDKIVTDNVWEYKFAEDEKINPVRDVDELNLTDAIEMIKSKLNRFELKLTDAEPAILKLTEERRTYIQCVKSLQQELDAWSHSKEVKIVEVRFPFLFVCGMALSSLILGYFVKPAAL